MRTFCEIYGSDLYHKMDFLVTCSECGQGMPFTDVLYVRHHMACPFCQRFIDHVSNLVIEQRRVSE